MTTFDVSSWDGSTKLPTLFARTAGGAITQWNCWVVADLVYVEWGQLNGAQQIASFKCEAKNTGKANATTAAEQAVKEAVAKWKKQIKKKYFLSEAAAQEGFNLKPMLAQDYNKRPSMEYPVHVQPKYDGVRCLSYWLNGEVYLQSRGGDPYDVQHIKDALTSLLPFNGLFDGELYIHGLSLQNIVSLVKRPQPESGQLTYVIYDALTSTDDSSKWADRYTRLPKSSSPCIAVSPCYTAATAEQVKELHDGFVQEGYEGAIIRAVDGVYRFGYRSPKLLKLKAFQDAEFPIIGYTTGRGKFSNVPIFRCVTGEGREFDVATRGTDADRAKMLAEAASIVGKQLTVRFFQWTDDRVPQFPVGICVREPGT